MAFTLIAFPDNMERSNREFDRNRSTDFTRAQVEATAIYDDLLAGADQASLLERVAHLTEQVAWLETWRFDSCQESIVVGGCSMPLSLAPRYLWASVEAMLQPRPRPRLRLVE